LAVSDLLNFKTNDVRRSLCMDHSAKNLSHQVPAQINRKNISFRFAACQNWRKTFILALEFAFFFWLITANAKPKFSTFARYSQAAYHNEQA